MKIIAIFGPTIEHERTLAERLFEELEIPAMGLGEAAHAYDAEDQGPSRSPSPLVPVAVPADYDFAEKRVVQHGPEHFIRRVIESLEHGEWPKQTVAITGLRTAADARLLKEHFGDDLTLVYIAPNTRDAECRIEPADQEVLRKLADVAATSDGKPAESEGGYEQLVNEIARHLSSTS